MGRGIHLWVLSMAGALALSPFVPAQNNSKFAEVRRLLREASALIQDIPELQRPSAQGNIAGIQARIGDMAGALETLNSGTKPQDQAMSLAFVANELDYSGDTDGALRLVESSKDDRVKAAAYTQIARFHAQKGDFERALQIIALVKDQPQDHVQVLIDLALAQSKFGEQGSAARTLESALEIVEEARKSSSRMIASSAPFLYANIASAQAQIGDHNAAMATLDRYSQIANEEESLAEKQPLLTSRAIGLAQIGEIELALELASQFQAGNGHDQVYMLIAEAQAKGGDLEGAAASAATIRDDNLREVSLGNLAIQQAAAGDFAASSETLTRVGAPAQAMVFVSHALQQADNGQPSAASQALQMALDAANKAGDKLHPKFIEYVAVTRALLGDISGAQQMIVEMKDPESKVWPLWNLTEIMVRSGDLNGALTLAESQTEAHPKSYALFGTATALFHQIEAENGKSGERKQ